MDYSFFDSLIDGVFVFDKNKTVTYCNEAAASLVGLSVRRVLKGKKVYELIQFDDQNLFSMPEGNNGELSPVPNTELEFTIMKSQEVGKIQLTLQPFTEPSGESQWILILHDVTLEETLHSKYHAQLEAKEEVIEELKKAKQKIEDYSKNLEKMVEERTEALNQANMTLKAIMNSLGQGFLTFNKDGLCGDIYTRACESILESNPQEKMIWEVLNLKEDEIPHIKMWLQACFQENLPFESLKDLGPSDYRHSQGWHISLDFYPIRDNDNKILQVVMVATDKTKQIEAERAMEVEKQNSLMMIKLVKNKDQFLDFLSSVEEKIQWLCQISEHNFNLEETYRVLHTLEGEAGIFSVKKVVDESKNCQQILEPLKAKITDEKHKIIKEFLNKVPDLKTSYYNFLDENQELFKTFKLYDSEKTVSLALNVIENYYKFLNQKPEINKAIEKFDNDFRKTDINNLFFHFDELIELVAEKTGKKVKPLKLNNNDIKVYHEPLKPFFNTLVHVFRNAVDHGIESPEERASVEKPESGLITIECYESDNNLEFIITDDGRGIDPDVIRNKLPNKSKGLGDNEVIQLIFEPGFSSKAVVSDFSGRGVGMDAVKNMVEKFNGHIHVESVVGTGTKLFIDLPKIQIDNDYRTAA